jgi:ATP-dependent DNA helicase PIF1
MEFLRAQNPSGLPLAKLKQKVGCPIVLLLRTLFPAEGLCNGTRLVVKALYDPRGSIRWRKPLYSPHSFN